jgi:hypothetical protein
MQFKVGKRYETKNGLVATITDIQEIPFNGYFRIVGIVIENGERKLCAWSEYGTVYLNPKKMSPVDLVPKEIPTTTIH